MHPNIGDALSGNFFSNLVITNPIISARILEAEKLPKLRISIYTLIIQVPKQKVKEPFKFFLEGIFCFFCQSFFTFAEGIFFTSDNTGIDFGVEIKE